MLIRHKVALVTGAAGGIGRAVALQCAREGAAVEGAGDIQHLVERCCAHFGRLDVACNLTGPAGVQGMRHQIEAMLRGVSGAHYPIEAGETTSPSHA